jgi:YhcH/YjgK/YiaL family protein
MFEVIEQVKKHLSPSVENGNYQLEGDDIFFFVVDENTKLVTECKSEIHRKYIDIQIVLAGEERFGYSLHPFKSITEDLLAVRDVAFSEDVVTEQFADLQVNDFIIFNAEQPHRPQIAVNEPMAIRKAIIKISHQWLAEQSMHTTLTWNDNNIPHQISLKQAGLRTNIEMRIVKDFEPELITLAVEHKVETLIAAWQGAALPISEAFDDGNFFSQARVLFNLEQGCVVWLVNHIQLPCGNKMSADKLTWVPAMHAINGQLAAI